MSGKALKGNVSVHKNNPPTPINAKKVINKARPVQVRKVCVLLFMKSSGMSIRAFLYSSTDTMTFCYSPAS